MVPCIVLCLVRAVCCACTLRGAEAPVQVPLLMRRMARLDAALNARLQVRIGCMSLAQELAACAVSGAERMSHPAVSTGVVRCRRRRAPGHPLPRAATRRRRRVKGKSTAAPDLD